MALLHNRLTQYTSAVKNVLAKYLGSKPAPGGLALVQGFINTAELEHGTDELSTPAGLRGWLTGVGLLERSAPVSTTDVGQATAVREALRRLTLVNNGEPPDPNALETLNRAARSAQLAMCFGSEGTAKLEPRAPGVDGALGRIIAAVHDAMAEGSWVRLKACPADNCLWAFFDETKNRSGTWCSMSVCGNRTKARAYRRRHPHAEHMEKTRAV
jgi:predicted RNA-binding Zn ribbon-like protein